MAIDDKVGDNSGEGLFSKVIGAFKYYLIGTFYPTLYQERYAEKNNLEPTKTTYYSIVIGSINSAIRLGLGLAAYLRHTTPDILDVVGGGIGLTGLYGLTANCIRTAYTTITKRPIAGIEWELLYRIFGKTSKRIKEPATALA